MRNVLGHVLLVAGLVGCDADQVTLAVGTLERDRIEVAADSNETILAIAVQEGDTVTAGTRLLVQDPALFRARLAQAQARRAEAAAWLEQAETGPRRQDIDQAEARLAAAQSAADTAAVELRRERALVERDFASANRVDVLEGRYREALARQREARAALAELLEGTRAEEIVRAREGLAAARAAVEEVQIALTQRDRSRLSYQAEVLLADPAADRLPVGVPVQVRFPAAAAGPAGDGNGPAPAAGASSGAAR